MEMEDAVRIVKRIVNGVEEVIRQLYGRDRETHTHTLSDAELKSLLQHLSPYTILYDTHGELCIGVLPSGFALNVPISSVSEECEEIETAVCRYHSPHQLSGGDKHTKESDEKDAVYSIGLILYECTCGLIPFDGYSTDRLRQLVPLGVKPDMSTLPPLVSSLITSTLSADSHTHPPTLHSLLTQLSLLVENPPSES